LADMNQPLPSKPRTTTPAPAPTATKPAPPSPPPLVKQPEPQPVPSVKSPKVAKPKALPLRKGDVYNGTIIAVQKDTAQIELYPGIVGELALDQWDYKPNTDLRLVCDEGEEAKVMIMELQPVLRVSRRAGAECQATDITEILNSFNETPDENGYLSLAKFVDDWSRIKFLLENLVVCYPDTEGTEYYAQYIPTALVTKTWTEAIKAKYNAKTISVLGPLFTALIVRGYIAPYSTNNTRIGYYLTKTAWDAVGGPEIMDIDPQIIDKHLGIETSPGPTTTNAELDEILNDRDVEIPAQIEVPAPPVAEAPATAKQLLQFVQEYKQKQELGNQLRAKIEDAKFLLHDLEAQELEVLGWLSSHAAQFDDIQQLKALLG
jgi:hypothetical protein